jgi:hypothetical protein
VEAYAVKPVEVEESMRGSAVAGVAKLAPGPLPGAGFGGQRHFTQIEADSGGV